MVTSISSAIALPAGSLSGGGASAALQDKLSRCEQQLGDWRACPSSKTPEGKKIIQDLQTQIRNLESRLASTDKPGGANTPPAHKPAPASLDNVNAATPTGNYSGTMGQTIDVFV